MPTYYYKVSGDLAVVLPTLLATGAAPVVSIPSADNPFLAVTVNAADKPDLDDAMEHLGFEFVAQGVGKEKSITSADSPYSPGQELIILADASGGPIVVSLPLLAGFTVSIRQIKVVKTDASANTVFVSASGGDTINGAGSYSLTVQYEGVEAVSGPSEWYALTQPSTGLASTLPVTTTDALAIGDIVAYDNNSPSRTVLADPDVTLVPTRYNAKGIAVAAAGAGTPTSIYSVPGQRVPVSFTAAPGLADNGKRVYLSTTPGKATLVAPGSGYAVVEVGILVGANGATTTPDVVFQFQVVSLQP